MKIKQIVKLSSSILIVIGLTGCGGYTQPPTPRVDNNESMRYINQFQNDYKQISKNFKDNTITKWIQPSNKKEKCEVQINFGIVDRTEDDSYKLFWDGSCKNNKANGLGRIFESTDIYEQSIITIYKKGKISNACFIKREFENETLMGECIGNELDLDFDFSIVNLNEFGQVDGTINNFKKIKELKIRTIQKPTYNVITKVYDDFNKFNVEQKYGTYGNINTPIMIMQNSPFSDKMSYQLLYYNYGYLLSNNFFGTYNDKDENHGHQIPDYKSGLYGIEAQNNKNIRKVLYPHSLLKHYEFTYDNVKNAVEKAKIEYKKAQVIKQKYKNKICDNTINVSFMKNKQYKSICNEDKYYANLQKKITSKLAMIEQKKHNKSLVNAEQEKANAYNRQANAQHRAAAAAESANFNQSMQNLNQNMQMNTLNNNLQMMRYGY